ncbi:hypothetical protein ACRALDRAFT_1095439 [Sodiomyces alcalophilus JCM 7366]|uniref:uncharacterized protein n=1 Tax=Sodiomyces alcalophilus JCM 7366 TaxID=591952 RepID=UPI0039B522A1
MALSLLTGPDCFSVRCLHSTLQADLARLLPLRRTILHSSSSHTRRGSSSAVVFTLDVVRMLELVVLGISSQLRRALILDQIPSALLANHRPQRRANFANSTSSPPRFSSGQIDVSSPEGYPTQATAPRCDPSDLSYGVHPLYMYRTLLARRPIFAKDFLLPAIREHWVPACPASALRDTTRSQAVVAPLFRISQQPYRTATASYPESTPYPRKPESNHCIMAWSQPQQTSRMSQLLPLIITFVILGGIAWVCWQVYVSIVKIQDVASQRMEKRNVVFTKDGVRVGVRHVNTEKYVDQTQSWVVKAWNLATGNVEDDGTDLVGVLQVDSEKKEWRLARCSMATICEPEPPYDSTTSYFLGNYGVPEQANDYHDPTARDGEPRMDSAEWRKMQEPESFGKRTRHRTKYDHGAYLRGLLKNFRSWANLFESETV